MLRMQGISKAFGMNTVLRGVDLVVRDGSIHGLIGHNGAGKSTLMKILQGVYEPDAGTIELGGALVSYDDPAKARDAGVAMVFQELSLIPTLNVEQNITLGLIGRGLARVDDRQGAAITTDALTELGVWIDPWLPVSDLTLPERQMVEIAKALRSARHVLVLDEPTVALNQQETEGLFRVMRELAAKSLSVVFISHKLREILAVCDTITVLRDGEVVLEAPTEGLTVDDLTSAMVGDRALRRVVRSATAAIRRPQEQAPLLELSDLRLPRRQHDARIDLKVYPGEIVGVVGLLGSGIDELCDALFGLHLEAAMELTVDGERRQVHSPAQALRAGIALLPADNRRHGIVDIQNVEYNVVLAILPKVTRRYGLDRRKIRAIGQDYVDRFGIGNGRADGPVETLSGGNQRKVALAKILAAEAKVLVLHEPTAGVDIGVAREIIEIARQTAAAGSGVLWVSSVLEEVIEVSDRIVVVSDGAVTHEFAQDDSTIQEEELLGAIQ